MTDNDEKLAAALAYSKASRDFLAGGITHENWEKIEFHLKVCAARFTEPEEQE